MNVSSLSPMICLDRHTQELYAPSICAQEASLIFRDLRAHLLPKHFQLRVLDVARSHETLDFIVVCGLDARGVFARN